VLHGVGDVDVAALNAGRFEGLVENLAGRTDKGETRQILLVARLLADEHERGIGRTFAEHGLRRVLVEIAAGAAARFDGK